MSEEKKKVAMEATDEKTALKAEEEHDDSLLDSSKVQFINGGASGAEVHVDVEGKSNINREGFCGLTKDELMEFANDPFWIKVRWILLVLFWVAWFGMLAAAIVIIVLAPKCPPRPDLQWWQNAMVYQVYPRSFLDTNGDGVGDIEGIHSKLDYLEKMNVSAVHINPMYPSPMADFGYDISDFKDIDGLFGSMQDFENLRVAMHKKGIRLIMDFVPNHSSRNHSWFVESRKGGDDNKYKDYYVWHAGKENPADPTGPKLPPNNWLSVFGGPAWTFDESRGEFYLHQFLPEQPDLNARNEAVQKELEDILLFWLDKKVDGFRIDALAHLFEVEDLSQDEPLSGNNLPEGDYHLLNHTYTTFQPETYELLTKWREILDTYSKDEGRKHPRALVVEAYRATEQQTLDFYKYNDKPAASMPINIALVSLKGDCNAKCVSKQLHSYLDVVGMDTDPNIWPNWQVGNHDQSRVATRMSADKVNIASLLLLTLPGTAFVYYGDEIGMHDVDISWEDTVDPAGKRWNETLYKDYSRDPQRTPMQWNGGPAAGFTTGDPWLPIAEDANQRNVEAQSAHGSGVSNLEVFKSLAAIRQEPSLQWGTYREVSVGDNILAYSRQAQGFPGYLIVLNFGTSPATTNVEVSVNKQTRTRGKVVTSTSNFGTVGRSADFQPGTEVDLSAMYLQPGEGVVVSYAWDE